MRTRAKTLLAIASLAFALNFALNPATGRAASDTAPANSGALKGSDSGLPLPRFVSLGSDKVNVRTGPGSQYPISWQYQRRGLPVEIIAEFEHWRRVRDRDGTDGWVRKTLLSGRRYALIEGSTRAIREKPDAASDIVAEAEAGVVVRIKKCRTEWCEVEAGRKNGYLPRQFVWGIYANEVIE